MVKNLIKTFKTRIPVVFAVVALAVALGTPASVLAADPGWYDGWFTRGGNLANETDWYNATYGYGQDQSLAGVRQYYDAYKDTSEFGPHEGQYERGDMYGGTYGPVSRGFGEDYEGRPANLGQSSASNGNKPYGYYQEESPGNVSGIYRGEPKSPPMTPNYYGSYPTEPGFSRFRSDAGLGYQPQGYYSERGMWYSPAWSNNMFGQAEKKAEKREEAAAPRESTYGYYQGTMYEPHYYTSDWGGRGGEFNNWW